MIKIFITQSRVYTAQRRNPQFRGSALFGDCGDFGDLSELVAVSRNVFGGATWIYGRSGKMGLYSTIARNPNWARFRDFRESVKAEAQREATGTREFIPADFYRVAGLNECHSF